MIRDIILNGLKMKVLDEYLSYILVHWEEGNEYLILRNESLHEYTIIQNFKSNKVLALKEFEKIG